MRQFGNCCLTISFPLDLPKMQLPHAHPNVQAHAAFRMDGPGLHCTLDPHSPILNHPFPQGPGIARLSLAPGCHEGEVGGLLVLGSLPGPFALATPLHPTDHKDLRLNLLMKPAVHNICKSPFTTSQRVCCSKHLLVTKVTKERTPPGEPEVASRSTHEFGSISLSPWPRGRGL